MSNRKIIYVIAIALGVYAAVFGIGAMLFSSDKQVQLSGLLSVFFGIAYITFGLSLKLVQERMNSVLMLIAIALLALASGLVPIILDKAFTISLLPIIYLIFIGKGLSDLLSSGVKRHR